MESPSNYKNLRFEQDRRQGRFQSMTLRNLLNDIDADYESDCVAEASKVTNTLIVTNKNKPREPPTRHKRRR